MTKVTKDHCLEIVNKFEPCSENQKQGVLGIDGKSSLIGPLFDCPFISQMLNVSPCSEIQLFQQPIHIDSLNSPPQ